VVKLHSIHLQNRAVALVGILWPVLVQLMHMPCRFLQHKLFCSQSHTLLLLQAAGVLSDHELASGRAMAARSGVVAGG
jgi:hypothetical protein